MNRYCTVMTYVKIDVIDILKFHVNVKGRYVYNMLIFLYLVKMGQILDLTKYCTLT